jgi:hypothetical protein
MPQTGNTKKAVAGIIPAIRPISVPVKPTFLRYILKNDWKAEKLK